MLNSQASDCTLSSTSFCSINYSTLAEIEEAFLRSCRNGDLNVVRELIDKKTNGEIELDISCKGKTKSNNGWTPLHLSTYFGHQHVMEALLKAGVEINAVNDNGDTPLHKAAFIGREVNIFF